MAPLLSSSSEGKGEKGGGKFDAFSRSDHIYRTIDGHDLWTSVWLPKTIPEPEPEPKPPKPPKPTTLTEPGPNGDALSPPPSSAPPETQILKVPVLIFFHGGGFIVGSRLYEPWWPLWLIEFASSQNAMIVAPDYRLLPEACGADIADDVDAFWSWFLSPSFPTLLTDIITTNSKTVTVTVTVIPDLKRIITAGHSAGGSLALLSALSLSTLSLSQQPNPNPNAESAEIKIKAVISLYAPLDNSVPELKISRPRKILGSTPPPPRQAEAFIRAYVQRTKGTTRSSGDPAEMWDLVACVLQQGRLPRMFERRRDGRLDLLGVIERGYYYDDYEGENGDVNEMGIGVRRGLLAPMWIVHGTEDSVVSSRCSTEFVRRVGEAAASAAAAAGRDSRPSPGPEILLSLRAGEEHNFDAALGREAEGQGWIGEGCEFLLKFW